MSRRGAPAAVAGLVAVCAVAGAFRGLAGQESRDIRGAWAAERYVLASGAEHRVRGRIFFTDREWTVLYFVLDARGDPRRGSAEGGGYVLEGDSLVFTHRYNLSGGEEVAGLPSHELRMLVREGEGAVLEPTRVSWEDGQLVLHFPSGNRMSFRKVPG